jgi:hypothetical protein
VYFDHDPTRLRRLADLATRVGAERFVLDDGPADGVPVSGALLERVGLWLRRRRPETVTLVNLEAGRPGRPQ